MEEEGRGRSKGKEERDKLDDLFDEEDELLGELPEDDATKLNKLAKQKKLAKRSKRVETAGTKSRQRKTIRTTLYAIGQAIFGGFLTIGKLGLVSLVKYVVSAASIPFEIINLIAEIDTLVEKESPPSKIIIVLVLGIGSMAFLAIKDAVEWGGYKIGFLASVAASGPFVFTGILSLAAVLSTVGFIVKARYLYKNPEYRTPLKKIGLIHKAIKTAGLAILAVSVALFAIAFVANPIGATVALAVIGATLVTMVTLKIIKTIQEKRVWEKTIDEFKQENKNPYDVVDPDRLKLHLALKYDAENNKKSFLIKLKDIVLTAWRSRFGTVEQKEEIAENKEKTVSAILRRGYEEKIAVLVPTKKRVNELKKYIEAQPDKALLAYYTEELKIAENAFKLEFEEKLKDKDLGKKILELQSAYDLVRKSRGRLLFQEAVEKACAENKDKPCFGNAAETDVFILSKIEAPELQEKLEKARAEEAKKENLVEKATRKQKERDELSRELIPSKKQKTDAETDTEDEGTVHPDRHH